MMTNSKKILLLVASTLFLFVSCKKNTDDQTDSEQYYKSQLEKLIHLKEIPSSPDTKSTSSFKTYKEAYEAFAFVRTGEVFSVTTAATEVKTSEGRDSNQDYYEPNRSFSVSPNLSTKFGNNSQLGCSFTINFTCHWQGEPDTNDWSVAVSIEKRSDPQFWYSGIGKMTNYGSAWSNLTFNSQIQGVTEIAGTSLSWFLTAQGGTIISPSLQPGGIPNVTSTLQVTSH